MRVRGWIALVTIGWGLWLGLHPQRSIHLDIFDGCGRPFFPESEERLRDIMTFPDYRGVDLVAECASALDDHRIAAIVCIAIGLVAVATMLWEDRGPVRQPDPD